MNLQSFCLTGTATSPQKIGGEARRCRGGISHYKVAGCCSLRLRGGIMTSILVLALGGSASTGGSGESMSIRSCVLVMFSRR